MTNIKENRDESMHESNPSYAEQPVASQEVPVQQTYDSSSGPTDANQDKINEVDKPVPMDEDKPISEDKAAPLVQNNQVEEVKELHFENGNKPPQTETKDYSFSLESKSGAEEPLLTSVPSENGNNSPQTEMKEDSVNTELKSVDEETMQVSNPSEKGESPPQVEQEEFSINLGSNSGRDDHPTVSSRPASFNGDRAILKKHDNECSVDEEPKSNRTPGAESISKRENEPHTGGKPEAKETTDSYSSPKPDIEPPIDGKLESKEAFNVNYSLKPDAEPPTVGTPEAKELTFNKSTIKSAESTGHENGETNDNGIPDSKPEALAVNEDTTSNNHLESANLVEDSKAEPYEASENKLGVQLATTATENKDINKLSMGSKIEPFEIEKEQNKCGHDVSTISEEHLEPAPSHVGSSNVKPALENENHLKNEEDNTELCIQKSNGNASDLFLSDDYYEGSDSGTEEEQSVFMKELERFFRERNMEFKPPKFYGEGLNCLKLWRAVMRLGGYDKVTSCKLWRQVGESFKPPKTCTTVSWTFRGFYEKALLEYERSKTSNGELIVSTASNTEPPMMIDNQTPGSGRARRDAAARAMQGWHSQRVLGNGEVSDPIIKDKSSPAWQKREKQVKSLDGSGSLKRKKPSMELAVKDARSKTSKQLDVEITDIGLPAEWVKINVQKMKDCFEVYALVPGLLREEVRVQLDPAGRLVISGEPAQPDNPWGVIPFKKVVSLPSRIDPQHTTAVVTLHGQLFVRAPFEQS